MYEFFDVDRAYSFKFKYFHGDISQQELVDMKAPNTPETSKATLWLILGKAR